MSWQLGLARLASHLGRDLQRPAREAGGGERLWNAPPAVLGRLLRITGPALADAVALRRDFRPEAERARLTAAGIGHVGLGEAGYPDALGAIVDPPFGLFSAGAPPAVLLADGRPVVAVVGSRRPTAAGEAFATELAARLTDLGALVVSGLALGIDAAAHRGALTSGSTLAVLGAGVDVDSPRRNAELRRRVAAGGAIVGEYWPGTEPAPWRFPARNRIVAGTADAVVVVEAGERSGALITADFALESGRPVLAVPGPPGAVASVGCNALLRAGAAMCEGPDDVVAELSGAAWAVPAPHDAPSPPEGLDGRVYDLLRREPLRPDEIAAALAAPAAELAAALGRLELEGLVLRGQGQRLWAAPLRGAA